MSFVPSCEHCLAKVPEATSLERVLCDPCREQITRTTTAAKVRQFRRDRAARPQVTCDQCGAPNPRKAYKLEPRNLAARFRILCARCRREHGYTEVDYARPAVAGTKAPDRGQAA